MNYRKLPLCLVLFGAACLSTAGPGETEPDHPCPGAPRAVEDVAGLEEGLYLHGKVYIAAQPGEEALQELRKRGVVAVVNTRTPKEVEDRTEVPFDEGEVVRALGMRYVSIPLGGKDHPYEPQAVERLAEVLANSDGPVLIHCKYGGRAVYLWLAHLIKNDGLTLDEAMERGEAMMLRPHPLGRLLGRPTKLVFADS